MEEMIESMFKIILSSLPCFKLHIHIQPHVFCRLYYFSVHRPGNIQDVMIEHI